MVDMDIRTHIKPFKRRAGLGCSYGFGLLILKWCLKNSKITKELRNKAVLNLDQYCIRCYVALSNVFQLF